MKGKTWFFLFKYYSLAISGSASLIAELMREISSFLLLSSCTWMRCSFLSIVVHRRPKFFPSDTIYDSTNMTFPPSRVDDFVLATNPNLSLHQSHAMVRYVNNKHTVPDITSSTLNTPIVIGVIAQDTLRLLPIFSKIIYSIESERKVLANHEW